MKIASLQYRYDFPKNFEAYQKKISAVIQEQASHGVDLLLFPEYAGLEMLSFTSIESLPDFLPSYIELFQRLSHKHRMLICNGTQLVKVEDKYFNRSYLFSPNHTIAYQDKCILTPEECQEGILSPGSSLSLIDTTLCKMGICICYDSEFPSLVKQLIDAGAQLILVPSYTSSVHGFYRVFLSCRARALENQCYVIQSALVGQTDVEMAYGASSICSPVDEGFPEDGLLAIGKKDTPESISATLDLKKLDRIRVAGKTHNYRDDVLLRQRSIDVKLCDLR